MHFAIEAAAIAFSREQASQDYPSRQSAVCVVTFEHCGDQPHKGKCAD